METVKLMPATSLSGKGFQVKHNRLPLGKFAEFNLTRSYSEGKISLENNFQFGNRKAAMHFVLNGQSEFDQNGKTPPARYSGDTCSLMLVQPHDTRQTMTARGDFAMVSLYLDLDRFISLMDIATEALPEKFQKAISGNVCSCNNFRWSPDLYYIINQLMNTDAGEKTETLFIESKMMELLAQLVDSEYCDYFTRLTISGRDADKIKLVRELLMNDLSLDHSLSELASMAGTNEFVLKKGFREMFGKPVYQFLMHKRMQKAMDLLSSSSIPVSEIGMMVGYEDASAFTRTFKRIFNLLPTQVRHQAE